MTTGQQEPVTGNRSPAAGDRFVWLSLLAFVALTTALALNHVMWRDEVRALSVAINSASWADLLRNLHTEGHPIVWYASLRAAYAVTHSVLVLPVLSLAFAIGAAYLILRYAPFPAWARLLIVFGVFLGYQFSVVARNYGVGVLLMIVACILFPTRRERPWALALTLAVMANTSVHAAVAALVLAFVWSMDVLNPLTRPAVLRLPTILSLLIAVAGVIVALVTAKPSAEMAFATHLSTLDLGDLLRKILKDPGSSIAGGGYADVAAAGSLPWTRVGIDPATASRVYVNLAMVSIAWALRKNRACLLGMLVAILGFAIVFRGVYTPSLRHEGVLFFLLVSLCWIACNEPGETATPGGRRNVAFGLLPLLVTQSLTLPVIVRRAVIYPESSSKFFGQMIDRTPRYRDAIIMSEPDYMVESMPYYVSNPVFMPRQREFHYRVYWDRGRRQQHLTLGQLVAIADSVTCATGRTALLGISYPEVFIRTAGDISLAYYPARFFWDPADKARLLARGRQVAQFETIGGDENYRVFEIAPRTNSGCTIRAAPR